MLMQTFMIEVRNDKAMALLRDLEELDIIKVIGERKSEDRYEVKTNKKENALGLKISQKLRGSIPLFEGDQLHRDIQLGREEWN